MYIHYFYLEKYVFIINLYINNINIIKSHDNI